MFHLSSSQVLNKLPDTYPGRSIISCNIDYFPVNNTRQSSTEDFILDFSLSDTFSMNFPLTSDVIHFSDVSKIFTWCSPRVLLNTGSDRIGQDRTGSDRIGPSMILNCNYNAYRWLSDKLKNTFKLKRTHCPNLSGTPSRQWG